MNVSRALMGIALAAALGLAGCETLPPVPSSAMKVSSGTGQVTYRTPAAGEVYVYDQTWHQLAYSGQVQANQVIAVDPGAGQVTVDGTPVVQKPLGVGDKFQIFLDKGATMTSTTVDTTTVQHSSESH